MTFPTKRLEALISLGALEVLPRTGWLLAGACLCGTAGRRQDSSPRADRCRQAAAQNVILTITSPPKLGTPAAAAGLAAALGMGGFTVT